MSAEFAIDPRAFEGARVGELVADAGMAVVNGLHKAARVLRSAVQNGTMYSKGGHDPIPPIMYDDDDVPAGNRQGKPMGDRFAVARAPVEPPAPEPAPAPAPPAEGGASS